MKKPGDLVDKAIYELCSNKRLWPEIKKAIDYISENYTAGVTGDDNGEQVKKTILKILPEVDRYNPREPDRIEILMCRAWIEGYMKGGDDGYSGKLS